MEYYKEANRFLRKYGSDAFKVIAAYEDAADISQTERYADWYGDYGVFEPSDNAEITYDKLLARYNAGLKYLGIIKEQTTAVCKEFLSEQLAEHIRVELDRHDSDAEYEIIAGHRRQRASELAGFANMPCIVRNMTDDEAILAMTDDNLRHRERILPTEKAQSLKMQVEAIKHQGSRPGEEDKDAGKRSTQVVGDRNGMNYKQVQRYIRLTELVPDLQKMVDEKKLAFTPAVEISFIRPKNQRYIAVSIEGQQSSPSLSQAQKMRELDKDGKLNGDVIDGILSQEKKEVDKVIINSAELEKYFGKDKSPREMKDKIISLLDDWKAKQPPELGKPEKKTELEK